MKGQVLSIGHMGTIFNGLLKGPQIAHSIKTGNSHLKLQTRVLTVQNQHRLQPYLSVHLLCQNQGHLPVGVFPNHGVNLGGCMNRWFGRLLPLLIIIRKKGLPMGAHSPVRIPFAAGTGVIPYSSASQIYVYLKCFPLVFNQAFHTSLPLPEAAGVHPDNLHLLHASFQRDS